MRYDVAVADRIADRLSRNCGIRQYPRGRTLAGCARQVCTKNHTALKSFAQPAFTDGTAGHQNSLSLELKFPTLRVPTTSPLRVIQRMFACPATTFFAL